MKRSRWLSFLLLWAPTAAFAEAPLTINLQGRLTDADGRPLQTRSDVTFALYQGGGADAVDMGIPVYKERVEIAPGRDGTYSHKIGDGTAMEGHSLEAADFVSEEPLYLQINIGNAPMLPRLQLVSTPYAIVAKHAETVQDDSVNTASVQDGTLLNEDVAPGTLRRERLDVDSFAASGAGLVPPGAVLMVLSDVCPAGYAEIPQLRGRFPIGADLGNEDPDVPNQSGYAFGDKSHHHSIQHGHGMTRSFYAEQGLRTNSTWVGFDEPKLVKQWDAAGGNDDVGIIGVSVDFAAGGSDTANSGSTTVYPPAYSVLFCGKN